MFLRHYLLQNVGLSAIHRSRGAWTIGQLSDCPRVIEIRVRTRSAPERDDGGEGDGRGEVGCELVVAGGHAPEVLEAAERGFDAPSVTIAPLVMPDRALA